MSRFGIDYAWHNIIDDAEAQRLRAAGVTFVGRYFSNNTDSKNLTHQEATVLSNHGIDIVCFWESTATRAEDGYAAGQADARRALQEAAACGMPNGRPIYFAIDEGTVVGPHITAYFQGVNSVLGVWRTGAYGSYSVLKALFNAGLIHWGFQTYAWSGGLWEPRAQFRQYSNGHQIAGISCDYDTAIAADFGQWRLGQPAPTPAPKPAPAPQPHTGPHPPVDVEGAWPYGGREYLGTARADRHCHSGYYQHDKPAVARYQHQMQVRGWRIRITGVYDAQTQAVTEAFQHQCGITKDGKVGPITWDHARHTPVTK
jgi:hypothetical protein